MKQAHTIGSAVRSSRRLIAAAVFAAIAIGSGNAGATTPVQQPTNVDVYRALATRSQLDSMRVALEIRAKSDANAAQLLAAAKTRLDSGDFHPGDLVLLDVQGEPTLTDTFVVAGDRSIALPAPINGLFQLRGVLRSELPNRTQKYIETFVRNPIVRVTPLVRISVQGEVARPGFYGVPADAPLSGPIMAAGGTTANADMKRSKINRNGRPISTDETLQAALADGQTVQDANLRSGDEILVARRRTGAFMESARLLSFMISIAGGIYGLSRIF